MAENTDIAFNLDINTDGGGKSLKDLKKDFNDIQKELSGLKQGTKEYQQALEKLGAVKDDIGDLRDTINALNPEGKVAAFAKVGSTIASGFAAAQGAAALFGSESEELQKTMLKVQAAMALAEGIKGIAGASDAFKVLNAVMKSNPIFLIVGAIVAVGAALYALKDKVAFIGKAFEVVGDIIGWVMDKVTEFTDAIGLSNSELTKQGKVLTQSINSATEALNKQTQAFDDQIAIAKASGKSTIDLEIAKQKAIIETNKALVEQTIAYVRNGGELDKERAKLLTGQLESIKKATVQIDIIEATANTKRLEDYKKHLDEKKKADEKAFEDYKTAYEKQDAEIRQRAADLQAYLKQLDDDARKALEIKREEEKAFADEDLNAAFTNISTKDERVAESNKKERDEKQKTVDQNINATKQGLQAAQALTDLYFGYQLRQAKGNAEKEKEIRKKQFNVNKAFGIANAVVDGFGAVQKALNNPYPLNIILAVVSGILAAANVAKIASTKFDDGGSSGGSVDTGGIGATASAPAIPQPNNTVTQIKDDGTVKDGKVQTEPQKVYVLETDIKEKNDRVANIEETAKIG